MKNYYEPELGQACFGQPWSEYELPEFAIALFRHILDEIARIYWNINQKQWDSCYCTEDPGIPFIEIHSYWWGDCECGFDEYYDNEYDEWGKDNGHTKECFHTRYNQKHEELFKLVPKEITFEEYHKRETKWAKKNGYKEAPYGMAVYCDCGYEERYEKFYEGLKRKNHNPDCPTIRPNFKYKNLEIRWYKYTGRGMSTNKQISEKEWRKYFDDCLKDLRNFENLNKFIDKKKEKKRIGFN